MSWKHSDVAMARNLLERWLTVAAAEIDTEKTARFATLILKRWLNQRDSSDSDTRELMELFHRVLHLWQRSTSQKSPDKAVNLLQTFQTQSLLYEEPRLRPGPRAYSMVFQTLMKSADASYATKETANQLIQQLQMQTLSPDTVVAQNSYLQFLGKKCGDVPEQAERFLRDEMVAPNEKSYAAVLQAWANSSDRPDSARRACDLLDEMMEKGMMNQVCINICLHALGNAGYGQRAEDLLWSMQRLYSDGKMEARPDAYSFLAVINAWAKSNNPEKATAILEHMLQQQDTHELGHTSAVYTAVMDAWARRQNSGPQVEALLHRLEGLYYTTGGAVRPCRKAYTIAIRAWGRTETLEAPDRATEIFRQMEALSKTGREDLAPCTIAYSSLIHAWAQSSRNDAPQRAMTILRHMEKVYRETGRPLVVPDTVTFNTVLSAFAKHGRADEARGLLLEMKSRSINGGGGIVGVRPDAISWATVIHAFSKSRRSDAGAQLNRLLHELEDLYDATGDTSLKPTPRIYAAVISAHARNTEAAEAVLWRMVDRYRQSVSDSHSISAAVHDPPNAYVCNALLQVWSQSDDPVAPRRAESILRWMEDQVECDLRPDKSSFNYVLRTWEQSKRRNASNHIERIRAEIESKYPHLRG
jgi:pentatricopeptide repeat protein